MNNALKVLEMYMVYIQYTYFISVALINLNLLSQKITNHLKGCINYDVRLMLSTLYELSHWSCISLLTD
jgi:hypothetical protein